MTKTKRLLANELRQMVGCKVSYRSHDATVDYVRPDMERAGLPSIRLVWAGGAAIIRPTEIA